MAPLTLIGATTENPYFEVNKALVSRSRIFSLKSLAEKDLLQIIDNTLSTKERGYGDKKVTVSAEAKAHLVKTSNGDARSLLNALELAVETTAPTQGHIVVDLKTAEDSIQKKAVLYDKEGGCSLRHHFGFHQIHPRVGQNRMRLCIGWQKCFTPAKTPATCFGAC